MILEDHLKFMLGQQKNTNFKPWKNRNAPANPHSCFGDFPLEHMQVLKFIKITRIQPIPRT